MSYISLTYGFDRGLVRPELRLRTTEVYLRVPQFFAVTSTLRPNPTPREGAERIMRSR